MDLTPTSLDDLPMAALENAERRLGEVAIVTRYKAPELMSVLNDGYVVAAKARAILARQVALRETALDALRALISLERAPRYLQEQGLATGRSPAGSEDQRKAIIARDPEYQQATNELTELRALMEVYAIRAKALDRAFAAVKAIYGDRVTNPYVSAGNEDADARRNADLGEVADPPPLVRRRDVGETTYLRPQSQPSRPHPSSSPPPQTPRGFVRPQY